MFQATCTRTQSFIRHRTSWLVIKAGRRATACCPTRTSAQQPCQQIVTRLVRPTCCSASLPTWRHGSTKSNTDTASASELHPRLSFERRGVFVLNRLRAGRGLGRAPHQGTMQALELCSTLYCGRKVLHELRGDEFQRKSPKKHYEPADMVSAMRRRFRDVTMGALLAAGRAGRVIARRFMLAMARKRKLEREGFVSMVWLAADACGFDADCATVLATPQPGAWTVLARRTLWRFLELGRMRGKSNSDPNRQQTGRAGFQRSSMPSTSLECRGPPAPRPRAVRLLAGSGMASCTYDPAVDREEKLSQEDERLRGEDREGWLAASGVTERPATGTATTGEALAELPPSADCVVWVCCNRAILASDARNAAAAWALACEKPEKAEPAQHSAAPRARRFHTFAAVHLLG